MGDADKLARKVMDGGELLWRFFVWTLILGIIGIVLYAALAEH